MFISSLVLSSVIRNDALCRIVFDLQTEPPVYKLLNVSSKGIQDS